MSGGYGIAERDGREDETHKRLVAECEIEETSYLWVKSDTPPFTPRVLKTILGDGRALFALSTINHRPRYWIIRGCSTWGCGTDREDAEGPDFAELTNEIMTHLEDCFGRGRCCYSGSSLFWPREERIADCQCEECDDEHVASWPEVDDDGGCSWSRMDWPKSFSTVLNPISWRGNLLASSTQESSAARADDGKEAGR